MTDIQDLHDRIALQYLNHDGRIALAELCELAKTSARSENARWVGDLCQALGMLSTLKPGMDTTRLIDNPREKAKEILDHVSSLKLLLESKEHWLKVYADTWTRALGGVVPPKLSGELDSLVAATRKLRDDLAEARVDMDATAREALTNVLDRLKANNTYDVIPISQVKCVIEDRIAALATKPTVASMSLQDRARAILAETDTCPLWGNARRLLEDIAATDIKGDKHGH